MLSPIYIYIFTVQRYFKSLILCMSNINSDAFSHFRAQSLYLVCEGQTIIGAPRLF